MEQLCLVRMSHVIRKILTLMEQLCLVRISHVNRKILTLTEQLCISQVKRKITNCVTWTLILRINSFSLSISGCCVSTWSHITKSLNSPDCCKISTSRDIRCRPLVDYKLISEIKY